MSMKGRSFLKLLDFTPEEITQLIDTAADLKQKKKAGVPHDTLKGKNIALIFEKTSTRTRCSFEVAAYDLGMGVTYLDPSGSGCWAAFTTASSTAAMDSRSWKRWRSMPACPSGTD